jgi:hypothetical protein
MSGPFTQQLAGAGVRVGEQRRRLVHRPDRDAPAQ